MTNFQSVKKDPITRESILFAVPLAIGLSIAGLGVALLTWPAWQSLSRDLQALQALLEQRDRIPLLRQQLAKLKSDVVREESRQNLIVKLIAGSGDISTFMAQLAIEAQRAGVQLDGYEPIVETASRCLAPSNPSNKPAQAAKDKNAPPPPPPDPILCSSRGLEKVSLLLTARGSGPALENFLRGLEKLSLLVVQRDLGFKYEPRQSAIGSSSPPVVMRLSLSLYRKAISQQPLPMSTPDDQSSASPGKPGA